MSRARLTARAVPELPGWRCVTIDCEHGTTTVHYVNAGALQSTDTDVAAVALARHYAAEGCACTCELRARYGQPTLNERAAAPPRRRRR